MRVVFAVHPRRPGFRPLARAAIILLLAASPKMGAEAPEPIRGDLVGVSKHATRFIHPPVFHFKQSPGAAKYLAKFTDAQKQSFDLETTDSKLNLNGLWQRMAPGPFSARVEVRAEDGGLLRVLTGNWHKAMPFDAAAPQAERPRPMEEVVAQVTDFLLGYHHPKAHQPDQPAMLWHAACNIAGGLHPYVYPAWGHAILIEYLLDYASWSGADPKLAAAGTALIPALVEVIEAHKTPSDWLYGDLYYSTGSRGQMGGHADADGIMPTMSGHTGLALHRVRRAESVRRCD